MGKRRVLGRVPGDREVTNRTEAVAQRNHAEEEHGAARWYKQGAKSESMGRVAEADGL
jgi:hypothetical protein